MIPYLIVFFISIFFTYFAEKNTKNRFIFCLYSFTAIFALSLLAGLRDYSIGTDVTWYVTPYFDTPKKNFVSLWNSASNLEPAFFLLIWCVKILGGNVSVALFFIQFISIFTFYYFFYKNRDNAPMHISMFVYCFVFYNFSLSLMRQFLAVPFALLAYYFLKEKRNIRFIISSLVAVMFHYASIFLLLIIFVFLFKEESKSSVYIKRVFLILFVFLFINLGWTLKVLNMVGIISNTYYDRFIVRVDEGGVNIYRLFFLVCTGCFSIIILKYRETYCEEDTNLIYLPIIVITVDIATRFSSYISRLSYYSMTLIFVYFCGCYKNSKGLLSRPIQIFRYLFLLGIIGYWLLIFVYFNSFETYPFKFI